MKDSPSNSQSVNYIHLTAALLTCCPYLEQVYIHRSIFDDLIVDMSFTDFS